MLTWVEIRTHVSGRWTTVKEAAGALLLELEIDRRKQRVLIEPTGARARPALIVVAEIGVRRPLLCEQALEYNATAEHGALAVAGGLWVVRQLLPLEGLTFEDVDGAIRAGASEAARFQRRVSRASLPFALSPDVFAHIAD